MNKNMSEVMEKLVEHLIASTAFVRIPKQAIWNLMDGGPPEDRPMRIFAETNLYVRSEIENTNNIYRK